MQIFLIFPILDLQKISIKDQLYIEVASPLISLVDMLFLIKMILIQLVHLLKKNKIIFQP